ncbi:unnamed protein product [Boreogadus saida]
MEQPCTVTLTGVTVTAQPAVGEHGAAQYHDPYCVVTDLWICFYCHEISLTSSASDTRAPEPCSRHDSSQARTHAPLSWQPLGCAPNDQVSVMGNAVDHEVSFKQRPSWYETPGSRALTDDTLLNDY